MRKVLVALVVARIALSVGAQAVAAAQEVKAAAEAPRSEGKVEVAPGIRLHYVEEGEGVPVVLVHGHSLDCSMWEPQMRLLSRFFRVIAYDVRGYGRSSAQREGEQFTHAADLVTLLDSLGIRRAHVVGLSMGGFITADMLAAYPERLLSTTMVSGNMRKSPGPSEPMSAEESARRDAEILALEAEGVEAMKERWLRGLLASGGSQAPFIEAPLRRMIDSWSAWQPLHKEARVLLGRDGIALLRERRPDVPALVVEGQPYGVKPRRRPDILSYLPSGQYVVLPDCGHMLSMERPFLFNLTLIRFLQSVREKDESVNSQ